jgi:hypothetical protein
MANEFTTPGSGAVDAANTLDEILLKQRMVKHQEMMDQVQKANILSEIQNRGSQNKYLDELRQSEAERNRQSADSAFLGELGGYTNQEVPESLENTLTKRHLEHMLQYQNAPVEGNFGQGNAIAPAPPPAIAEDPSLPGGPERPYTPVPLRAPQPRYVGTQAQQLAYEKNKTQKDARARMASPDFLKLTPEEKWRTYEAAGLGNIPANILEPKKEEETAILQRDGKSYWYHGALVPNVPPGVKVITAPTEGGNGSGQVNDLPFTDNDGNLFWANPRTHNVVPSQVPNVPHPPAPPIPSTKDAEGNFTLPVQPPTGPQSGPPVGLRRLGATPPRPPSATNTQVLDATTTNKLAALRAKAMPTPGLLGGDRAPLPKDVNAFTSEVAAAIAHARASQDVKKTVAEVMAHEGTSSDSTSSIIERHRSATNDPAEFASFADLLRAVRGE